ncbi:hypothetical protein ACWGNE_20390, partial [Streptomyces xiamenensis]
PVWGGWAPRLTRGRHPRAEWAKWAAGPVLRPAGGGDTDPPRLELATELVVRASTAPPAPRPAE